MLSLDLGSCATEAQGSAAEALPAVLGDQDGVDAVEPLTHGVAGSWYA
jgi:hypothetical protein